ncbi:MAG: glycosyltransferase family 4 protein [bacterium]
MKVTIVVGGRWHAFDLARELHQLGHLHRLITNYPKFKTRQWQIPDEKVVSLPFSFMAERMMRHLGGEQFVMRAQYFIHRGFAEAAAKRLEGSDIVHGWSSFSEPSIQWCRARGIPFILERGSAHMSAQCELLRQEREQTGERSPETHPQIVAMELREYEMADRVAVPSRFVESTFHQMGFPAEKLLYNPLGVNLQHFQPGTKEDAVFRVIYAGAMSMRKGIRYFVEGFLRADLQGSELLLIGGKLKDTEHLLKGKDGCIRRLEHVPQAELVRHYQQGSVFVISSVEEGMAMVQAQAMACGLPLICTTNTGGEDLLQLSSPDAAPQNHGAIKEYPAGYVTPIRDPEAIAWCLKELKDKPQLLREKSEAALRIRSSRLDWRAYAERAVNVYQNLSKGTK